MPGFLLESDGVCCRGPLALGELLSLHLPARELVAGDLRVIGRGLPRDVEAARPGSHFELRGGEDHCKVRRKHTSSGVQERNEILAGESKV